MTETGLFTKYVRSTGEIISYGLNGVLEWMEDETHAVLIGENPPGLDTHRVDLQTGQIVPLPEKPDQYHVFDYDLLQWVDPRTAETQWPIVRAERNALLSASDWTQLPDVPLDTKEAWAAYRQALRDITNQPDPFNIVWPVPPGVDSEEI
jgi:hypothetical protein